MNKSIIFISLMVVASGGVGGLVGFFICKKKYEKKITKEVEAVEEYYKGKKASNVSKDSNKTEEKKSETKIPVDRSSIDLGSVKPDEIKNYGAYFKDYEGTRTPEKFDPNKPYIVSEQDYANSEYDTRSLFLFADGVLTDDDYNVIEDISGIVGNDAVNEMMKDNSPSAMYVRNEKYKLDYEILRDNRYFKEVSPFHKSVIHPEDEI